MSSISATNPFLEKRAQLAEQAGNDDSHFNGNLDLVGLVMRHLPAPAIGRLSEVSKPIKAAVDYAKTNLSLPNARTYPIHPVRDPFGRVLDVVSLDVLSAKDIKEVLKHAIARGQTDVVLSMISLKDPSINLDEIVRIALNCERYDLVVDLLIAIPALISKIPTWGMGRAEVIRQAVLREEEELLGRLLSRDESQRILLIMNAARMGDLQSLPELLKNVFTDKFCQAVTLAIAHKHDIEKWFVEQVNNFFNTYERALLFAARNGYEAIFCMLAKDTPISQECRGGAAVNALRGGHLNIARELLKDKDDLSDENRGEALLQAAFWGDLALARELLEHGSISDNCRGNAVRFATGWNDLDLVQKLLKTGPISDNAIAEAVSYAVQLGNLAILQKLLDSGAISDIVRGMAVRRAAASGLLDIVHELLNSGAIYDTDRGKAVRRAAASGHLDIVHDLLSSGAISDTDRGVAVRQAAANGNLDIVHKLLESGAISDTHRGWAVREAAANGHLDIVHELLNSGAISDTHRGWAAEMAFNLGFEEVGRMILRSGPIPFIVKADIVFRAVQRCRLATVGAVLTPSFMRFKK